MRSIALTILLFLGVSQASADVATHRRDDVAYLVWELERVHPKYRECGIPPAMREFASQISHDAGSMTADAFAVSIQRLLAMAGDGHTLLFPFSLTKLPLMLWWFDDGIFVVEGPHAAKRVSKIGDLDAVAAMRRLEPFVSRDNEMQFRWAAPFYATLSAFLSAADLSTSFVLEDGTVLTLEAQPIDPGKLELNLVPAARRNETFRSEEMSPGILYVAVNAMSPEAVTFAKELRPKLETFDCAILDLRLNNGGDASNADELMKSWIGFDMRGGRSVTLISRMTYSAAQTFATRIDQWTSTKFAGEPTGSRPNRYGNERPFILPNTKLRGSISSGWNQPVTSRDQREAITPEIVVPQLAKDFFANRDSTLAVALQHLDCAAAGVKR
jgi:hypothetical protein